MLRLFPLLLVVMLFFSTSAWTQEVTGFDRFKLWNSCGPMSLLVESLPEDATNIGLTKEAIVTSVRSRLRAARLYVSGVTPYIYVNVNVVGRAFGIGIGYNKWVFDPASNEEGMATVWTIGSTGTHGRNSNYIVSSVSQHIDKFIDEYFRVNEEACRR